MVFQLTMASPVLFRLPLIPCLILAAPMLVAGIFIMGICVKKYFFYLSGVDVFYKKPAVPALQTGGLHRIIRHPLYFGTLLFIWGLFLLFTYLNNLIACLVISLYTLIGAKLEEQKLQAEFGAAYEEYSKKVPMLIPDIFRVTRKDAV